MVVPEHVIRQYYRTTGVQALDRLMYGWPRRGLALIYGSEKAGKTTLALQAAIQVVLSEEGRALLLDTESGGIGELRLESLAMAMGVKEDLISMVKSRINVYRAAEMAQQHDIIMNEFDMAVKQYDVSLFVVDSISWHYHQRVMNAPAEHVGSVAREMIGRLESQTKTLLKYAEDTGASVIFTSWSASKAKKAFEDHQRREVQRAAKKGIIDIRDLDLVLGTFGGDFIGGRYIGYLAKVIARIWRLQGNRRFFVVEAHREKPDNMGLYMQITEAGLQPLPGAEPVPVERVMLSRLLEEEEAVVSQDTARGGEGRQPSARRYARGKN
jgi:RecA/RadA recombinase